MLKKIIISGFIVLLFSVTLLILNCVLPADATDPSGTTVTAIVRTTDSFIHTDSVHDTTGKLLYIGAAVFLPKNVDSLSIEVTENNKTIIDTVFRSFKDANYDTIWVAYSFITPGEKFYTVTPYTKLEVPSDYLVISITDSKIEPKHSVVYIGNGNSDGSVPVDTNNYASGETVTILDNTGSLIKNDATFIGWNTKADGTGDAYTGGDTLSMGATSYTLYAQWDENSANSFVVWSEGSHCDRELKYQKLNNDKVPIGEIKTVVNKGDGPDIMVVISYDGVWIAFSRFIGTPTGTIDGPCDYHAFTSLDIYVARIDKGNILPAAPIKAGHGCWASWAMDSDAKDPRKPHTLYFTSFEDKQIKKVVIQLDGASSVAEKFCDLPSNTYYGTHGHIMMAPNGRYIAYRPIGDIVVWDLSTNKVVAGAGGRGQHPCWGPRSKYLIWAYNNICTITDNRGYSSLNAAGFGIYHYGISNDAEYDQGRLWAIGRLGGGGQNTGGPIAIRPINITNSEWNTGASIAVSDSGTWCDIHIGTATQ